MFWLLIGAICSSGYIGSLITHNGDNDFSWTLYNYTYVANTTQPSLIFGFEIDNNRKWRLDTVSVTDVIAPGTQLLQNPNFENSSSTFTGWNETEVSCGGSSAAQIETNSGSCESLWCFRFDVTCSGASGFLSQTFTAIIGHTYTISYYLRSSGNSGSGCCGVTVI